MKLLQSMTMKTYLRQVLSSILHRYGFEIVDSRNLYEWQNSSQSNCHCTSRTKRSLLPSGASEYLVESNPILKDLRARYAAFNAEVTNPLVWTDNILSADEMLYFRGENAYVWQLRGANMNILAYALTTYYIKSIDTLGLLQKLEEDGLFGNCCFSIDSKLVSRDLLDSIVEIYFLEKHLSLSTSNRLTVLDIGAGYGRLAHRMQIALPNIANYFCVDAFPTSSFISQYYLKFRNLEEQTKVVPLDEIEETLKNRNVDIALNIHSFSECKISAIEWWLSLLAKYRVRYLMVVPNPLELQTNDGIDFSPIIKKHGYRLLAQEPKFRDPIVQQYAINPTNHYLFELR